IRQVVHWVKERFSRASKEPGNAADAQKWSAVLERVEKLGRQIDEGPFELRLKVAIGRSFEHDWEEVNGKREYAFEKRSRVLAEEAVSNPDLMTDVAWKLLKDKESSQAHNFIISLGKSDPNATFFSK